MSKLLPLPKPPEGVQLGLKCPQSVLYMDLGLRGCLASAFRRIYSVDYAYNYIVYDATEKSFDFTHNHEFHRQLSPELKADVIAQKYITISMRNARRLIRTAQIVSSPTRWRSSHLRQDLLEDLNKYWDAYEDHANTMYVFWGVEHFIMNNFIDELRRAGFQKEVDSGLPSFIVPSEPNWFTLEQQNLEVLKSRFGDTESETTLKAASFHANTFGVVYTPYNLGTRPTGEDIVEYIKQPHISVKSDIKSLDGFPENIVRLGELVRELAFWKSERTDTLSIADHYATSMYKTLSDLLEIPLDFIYFMTRDELTEAINGTYYVSDEMLEQRKERYCIALIDGKISFYEPTGDKVKEDSNIFKSGDILKGLPTSVGVVRGKVKIISLGEENPVLEPDEIIVTSMTRPELGVALDVALAYVTDEGGRLCHAAIVSREKNKPCVTATRKATQVLQNGMLIEVDGSKGIVTVL